MSDNNTKMNSNNKKINNKGNNYDSFLQESYVNMVSLFQRKIPVGLDFLTTIP